jgi:hypothetical protein
MLHGSRPAAQLKPLDFRRNKMAYSYLAIAIIAEVIATSALKAS